MTKFNIEDINSLPDCAPLTNDPHYNKAMECIRAFELQQMAYQFQSCSICNECKLQMKMSSTAACTRCAKDKNNIKMFSAQNFMDPRKVPKQLEDFSIVEQQLICRLSPAINVHMLKHGGVGANGHCVTFPQAIDEPAQIFPRLPHEIKIIRIRKQGKNDRHKDFIVRRERVQEALQWLQKNNPAYSDIKISSTRLQQLPLHGELPDIQTIHYQPSATHTSDNGPAPEQMPPQNSEECQTNSGVLLPEPNVHIQKQISNIVADVTGKQAPTVTMHKKNIQSYHGLPEMILLCLNLPHNISSLWHFLAYSHMHREISLLIGQELVILLQNGLNIYFGIQMADLPVTSTSNS